jgi:hypothetical protein
MKTIIATAALTVMFLSAGAFAGNNHRMVQSAASLMGSNVTVIEKNQAFPILGPITVEVCQVEDCSEV